MMTRRNAMQGLLAGGAAVVFTPADLGHAAGAKLSWKHFPAGQNGFFRAPVLLTGPTEALLIDGGFNYPDGRAVVEAIKASGKKLTAIYVSQSDPDYYFSLKPMREAFPGVRVLAASTTLEAMNSSVGKKLSVWGPQLKENGPQTMADIVLPEAFDGPSLPVDGETVEIVNAEGLANRRYVWVPSLRAVFGGVMIFSGVHVWTADTPSKEQRMAWVANLDKIVERKPEIVVAGHMTTESAADLSGVQHTKAYLLAFEEELTKTANAAALKAAMEAAFPGLGMGVGLDIGSKVAKGEMKWG
jgi:glyoxylase-like metal-dependent hydrolase (beta-lactamase superfamily II)